MAFDRIIVLTRSQCLIHSVNTLDSPIAIDFKEDSMYGLALGPKSLAIIGWNGIKIYSHHGKYLSSPNYQITSAGRVSPDAVSIGYDVLAIIDDSNKNVVRFFSCETGDSLDNKIGKIIHEVDIEQIYLSHKMGLNERYTYIIMIDKKKDMFIKPMGKHYVQHAEDGAFKLGTHITSAAWDEKSNILCCLEETKANLYYFPLAPFVDIDLLNETKESIELGTRCAKVVSFCGNQCTLSLQNESAIHVPVSEGYSLLHEYASSGNWDECLRLCRFRNIPSMWATLACLAIQHDELEAAESALVAIRAVDKLQHLRSIRAMPQGEVRYIHNQ